LAIWHQSTRPNYFDAIFSPRRGPPALRLVARSSYLEHGNQRSRVGGYFLSQAEHPLIARYGIEEITAPAGILAAPVQPRKANVDLHLSERNPVSIRMKLGTHEPMEWVKQVALT
jgi:hypothetical protein